MVVAVSGGPDSVALLLALADLKDVFPLHLLAAHVNHMLRGEESDEDQRFVDQLCRNLEVPVRIERVDTRRIAEEKRENLENYGRLIRYRFFSQLAAESGGRVATAHTLNDQAETFLMKLMRGAGPAGLSGINPLRVTQLGSDDPNKATVVRPLLEVTRREVLDYLSERRQSCRWDPSNQDLSFDRNWVRHQLIPQLEERLNPALLETLHRSAGLFGEVEDFLLQQGKEAFQKSRCDSSATLIHIEALENLPAIVQKEVVRHAIREVSGRPCGVNLHQVVEILRLLRAVSGKQVHLPAGIRVQREFDRLRFTAQAPTARFSYRLSVPGQLHVREAGKSVLVRRAQVEETDPRTQVICWSGDFLTVRNRRPGDRYRLSAGCAAKKLKELFQEMKIPRGERDKLLVLEGGGEIIWVEGVAPLPRFREGRQEGDFLAIQVCDETLDSGKLLK